MKLQSFKWIFASWILFLASPSFADYPQETSSTLPIHILSGTDVQPKARWEETLSDVNSRVQQLLEENDRLMKEYESLQMQLKDVQYKVNEQKRKNIDWLQKSKEAEMPDVETKAKELRQSIKDKQNELATQEKDLVVLNKKISVLEKRVEVKKLKDEAERSVKERERQLKEKKSAELMEKQKEIIAHKEAELSDEVKQITARLEENKKHEDQIQEELKSAQSSVQIVPQEEITRLQTENQELQNQISSLGNERDEKLQKPKNVSQAPLNENVIKQKKEYLLALKDKTSLQSRVVNLEAQLQVIQNQSSPSPASWEAVKKELANEIATTEKANQALREESINYKENIYILKDRISRIEERMRIKSVVSERKKNLKKYEYNPKQYKLR